MLTTYETRLIGRKQIAAALDVHPVTVSRWTAAGRLPVARVGHRLEADAAALVRWRDSVPALAARAQRLARLQLDPLARPGAIASGAVSPCAHPAASAGHDRACPSPARDG